MNRLKLVPLEKPITATIDIPGSKSYTNRALVMAALTKGKVTIKNQLVSDDTIVMSECLKKLTKVNDPHEIIDLNANLSGTTIRFILALSCLFPGTKIIHGEEGLNKRPIKELVEGLRQLGANISYENNEGFPPLKVTSSMLYNGITKLSGDISSQYFTALMMIAPAIGGITIEVIGNQISKPYVDMTIDMMKQWGVTVENQNYQKYIIRPNQEYRMNEYIVEGDFSAAGYFFAIAALTKSTFTLKNLNPSSKQGDLHFVKILEQMGNKVTSKNNEMTIIGSGVQSVEVDMEPCPDQAQTLAVLATFANGKTTMKGIRSLRVKETERVVALQNELKKMGIKSESTPDTLTIYGGNPKPATIDTYGDHRMAMSFAVAGTKLTGMEINNPDVVNKTFPTFWKKLEKIGVHYE